MSAYDSDVISEIFYYVLKWIMRIVTILAFITQVAFVIMKAENFSVFSLGDWDNYPLWIPAMVMGCSLLIEIIAAHYDRYFTKKVEEA